MQMDRDYDMHRVTDLMSVKKPVKGEAAVTRTQSAGSVQGQATKQKKIKQKKIEVHLIENKDDHNSADDME